MHDFPLGNFQFDDFPEPVLWIPEIVATKTVQTVRLADGLRDLSYKMSLIGTQPDIPDEDDGFQAEDAPVTPPTKTRPRRVKGRKEKSDAASSAPLLILCDVSVRYYISNFLSHYSIFGSVRSLCC